MCDKNFRNISGSSCDLTVSDKRRRVGIHFTLKQQMGLGYFLKLEIEQGKGTMCRLGCFSYAIFFHFQQSCKYSCHVSHSTNEDLS